jgi:hypothetical protein
MLDDATEGVSVSSDEDALAGLDVRHDDVVPVGQRPLDGQLEALGLRELVSVRSVLVPEGITPSYKSEKIQICRPAKNSTHQCYCLMKCW